MSIKYRISGKLTALISLLIMLILPGELAVADGTETLGQPSFCSASPGSPCMGDGIVAAGTGMFGNSAGTIEFTVPAGATVETAHLYWAGFNLLNRRQGFRIRLDANLLSNWELIGGPTNNQASEFKFGKTYRADITSLVGPGLNSFKVRGMNFDIPNGAGILVIYSDDSNSWVDFRDGDDYAFAPRMEPLDRTTTQVFDFPASDMDRTAKLDMFFSAIQGAASGGGERPNRIVITVGNSETIMVDPLSSNDGDEWDTAVEIVNVPAGVTRITVTPESVKDPSSQRAGDEASFVWHTLGLSISLPQTPDVSLGDRVWEDLNRDGIQNCTDTNMDGILGNQGDQGNECDEGISSVEVKLLGGPSCEVDMMMSTLTDFNGFYEFTGLAPGDYCVEFDIESLPDDFCEVDLTLQGHGMPNLGAPDFTLKDANGDSSDSDADPATGRTDSRSVLVW